MNASMVRRIRSKCGEDPEVSIPHNIIERDHRRAHDQRHRATSVSEASSEVSVGH
jgi:hypothetical protein